MRADRIHGDERLPVYQRLADTLRHEIVAGHLRPGDRVPSESELCERFGLAVGTVRKALELLVADRLLERFHGRGTFIRRPGFGDSLFRFFRFRDADGQARVPEGKILSRRRAKPGRSIAAALRIEPGDPAIEMHRVRLHEGIPVLLEQIWLPLPRFEGFLSLDTDQIGNLLYPVYEAHCGQLVARADETLTVERATQTSARSLGIEPGAPIVAIDRIAFGYDDTPLEWRRSLGRADQFRYHTEIR